MPPIRTEKFVSRSEGAAIRMVLEVCQGHKCNHSLVLDSGSDRVSGENNQNIVLLSPFMVLLEV